MFTDRTQAGRALARALTKYASSPNKLIVLALPRGGIPVAVEVARALHAPLDVVNVRKLGTPTNPEFAFGAVGEGGSVVLDQATIDYLGVSQRVQDQLISEALSQIDARIQAFRGGRDITDVTGRTVIVVDDGLATGATAQAAVSVLRNLGAARIILAVPTGSQQAVNRLAQVCDEVVSVEIPGDFGSVGGQYEHFPQVSEQEVIDALSTY